MPHKENSPDKFEQLRNQAEKLVRQQPEISGNTPNDILELINELKIHQAELEIQNEELSAFFLVIHLKT